MKELKIPQCDSIRELGRFWDTHDLTDYGDQLGEVTDTIFEKSKDRYQARWDKEGNHGRKKYRI